MASSALPTLRRALLYVPAVNPRFLTKSLGIAADNVTYDLEDSVTEATKPAARKALQDHLASLPNQAQQPAFNEVAVRINAVSTRHALDDIRAVAAFPALQTLVIPKVNSAADLALVDDAIRAAAPHRTTPLRLLALIESARAVMDLRAICDSGEGSRHLRGLIFAAEDFARDLSLTRTVPMTEMLYARSAVVTAARAFELESAIDVVCTVTPGVAGNPRLVDECEQGRGMGFNGKQCVHPAQVETVQRYFSPSQSEIDWATRIVVANEKASVAGRGAWTLDGKMIDAPVVGAAQGLLNKAKRCGLDIDATREKFKDVAPE